MTGTQRGAARPPTVNGIAAPPRAITVSVGNRSVGPLPVSSRVAADSTLPTTRLTRWWLSSSIGPFGGTPTCQ